MPASSSSTRPVLRRRALVRRPRYTARTADKYELYQLAVQSPEHDLAFVARHYRRERGREPLHLREDFCGTAFLSATWVKGHKDRTAEGYDLDATTLAWSREHNLAPLGAAAQRVALHQRDVRVRGDRPADIRLAQNFSYCIFKTRAEMVEYFRCVHRGLAKDGLFALDIYGGTEATEEMEEERKVEGGFTYVWDQHRYLPGTNDYTCHIHFRFRDGTEMKRAFTYEWRFWSMPEIKELLREAGFRDVRSYFEQSNAHDEGSGIYKLDETGASCQNCAGWVAYILAFR
ncbi:MAG: class I SAM-dependent methyltransferase [Planctomycetota bacterium]|nr:class I SAM-dependent methyltransferase [Planctomycetota bacterium]